MRHLAEHFKNDKVGSYLALNGRIEDQIQEYNLQRSNSELIEKMRVNLGNIDASEIDYMASVSRSAEIEIGPSSVVAEDPSPRLIFLESVDERVLDSCAKIKSVTLEKLSKETTEKEKEKDRHHMIQKGRIIMCRSEKFIRIRTCTFCGKIYVNQQTRLEHEAAVHHKITYNCSYCPRIYTYDRSRRAHEKRVHTHPKPKKLYPCPLASICGHRGFSRPWGNIDTHINTVHGDHLRDWDLLMVQPHATARRRCII